MDESSPASRGERCRSLDNLVGAGEDQWRHSDAKRLGGLEIYDELKGRRLLNRQIGRSFALQNSSRVNPDLAKEGWVINSIADQAAGHGELSQLRDRRYGVA